MNRKRKVFLVIIFCMGVFCGCGSRNNVYLETIQTETDEVPQTEEKDCQEDRGSCIVYVCGAVENPGVYELPENSRVYEAVADALPILTSAIAVTAGSDRILVASSSL